MPLVKAQCTNCGGNLEVDESKEAAICPFCNTPYVVEKAINQFQMNNPSINIQSANINVSGALSADDMFENWLLTRDMATREKLVKDFRYNYASDPRSWYIEQFNANRMMIKKDYEKMIAFVNQFFVGRFEKYKEAELGYIYKKLKSQREGKVVFIVLLALTVIAIIILIITEM